MVEPKRALQRQPAERPLLLGIDSVEGRARIALIGGDVLRQLVRHAVVQPIGELLVVGVPDLVVGQVVALVSDLEAVRAGDEGGRRPPVPRALPRVEPILRSVDQTRDVAIGGAPGGALLGHANERSLVLPFRSRCP